MVKRIIHIFGFLGLFVIYSIAMLVFEDLTACILVTTLTSGLFIFLAHRYFPDERKFKWIDLLYIILGIVILLAIETILINILFHGQSFDTISENEQAINAILQKYRIAFSIIIVVLAPICEEIIFRAYIDRKILAGLPSFVPMIVSSLLFGLAHTLSFQPVSIVYIGMGLGLWICYKMGGLKVSIPVHMINNALSLIAIIHFF